MNIIREIIIYGRNISQSFWSVDNVCLRNEIDGTVSIQFQAHDDITLDKPENLSIAGVEIWSQDEHTSALRQDIYTLSNARIVYDQTLQSFYRETLQDSYRDSYNTLDINISGILTKRETRDYSKEEKGEEDVGNNVKRTFIKVKFPDARFRFTGKGYVYELDTNYKEKVPKERDFIQIKLLKDKDARGNYCPAYGDKDLLVTEVVTLEGNDDIDPQLYFSISTWKTIQEWTITKEFHGNMPELSELLDGGAVVQSEIIKYEEKLLKDAEPLKSVNNTICASAPAYTKVGDVSGGFAMTNNDCRIEIKNGTLYIHNGDNTEKVLTEKVEEKRMSKNMFDGIMKNFKFGKVDSDRIAYSMSGIAFKNASGDYIVYNEDGTATNVSTMAFQLPLFAMPVPLTQIKAGDVIAHNNKEFVLVKEITKTTIVAVSPERNEIVTIVPEKSIFGFAYYTKVISPMTMFNNQASESNPFGNMLPFMLMGDSDFDSKDAMLMMMMCGGAQNQNIMLPMMFMANKDSGSDMAAFMMAMMMSGNNSFAQNNIQE